MYSGHIEKRSEGVFLIIIETGRDHEGKRKRIKRTFKGKIREAKTEMARMITELESGIYIETSKLTFGQYLERWLKDYAKQKVADKTYVCYEQIFKNHTIPRIGQIQLDKLKPLHLQTYYNELLISGRKDKPKDKTKTGLSASSVVKHHRIIHKALETAVKWQLLPRNVADAVDPPKQSSVEMSSYDAEDVQRMLKSAKDQESFERYALLVIAVCTGMRRGEILGLRWKDIDWNNQQISIRQTVQYTKERGIFYKEPKTKKGIRNVDVTESELSLLKQFKAEQAKKKIFLGQDYQDNDLIFCQDDGKPMHPDTISSWFRLFLKRHNLPLIRFHDLRHTHVTLLLKEGVPIVVVADRVGHATPSTTSNIYSHALPSMQKETAKKIGQLLSIG